MRAADCKRYRVTQNVQRTINLRRALNKKVPFSQQSALFSCVYAKKALPLRAEMKESVD